MRLIYKTLHFVLSSMSLMTMEVPRLQSEDAVECSIRGYVSPIYVPRRHTVESYRSQQRKAKKRK